MIQVAKISEAYALSVKGTLMPSGSYFNPVQDCNGNWIMSVQQIQNGQVPESEIIEWIDWCAPPTTEVI